MKTTAILSLLLFFLVPARPQSLSPISLNSPNKERGSSLMQALENRHSTRTFSPEMLSLQDLSDLLWASIGKNRPDGRRTAASARNNQDIDVYVILKQGAFLYDAGLHVLNPVNAGDFRAFVADSQPSVLDAPVFLLLVSEQARFTGLDEETRKRWGAIDAGIVSQNVMLFASACGLVTVPRDYMNKEKLREVLHLSDSQIIMLNNPVGYPQKTDGLTGNH